MKEKPLRESRKYPRISVDVSVSYDCYDDNDEIIEQNIGTILDVSEGGVLIETDAIIDANYIRLVIARFDNQLQSITGSAVNSKRLDNGKARTGICFHGSRQSNSSFVTAVIRTFFYNKKAS